MLSSQWQSILTAAGLADCDYGWGTGDATAEARAVLTGDAVALLPEYGIIRVSGDDAEQFLQGQFTVDMQAVTEGTSRLGAWCTPKGRVMFLARLLRQGSEFLIVLPAAQVEACLNRLRLYVMRAAVTASAESEQVALGLAGENVRARLMAAFEVEWPGPDVVRHAGDFELVGLDGRSADGCGRALLLGPAGPVRALLIELIESEPTAAPVGPAAWRLLDIQAGQPWLESTLSEQFLPQMLNLDHLGGISFDKGCYVGQEIVARTQYLGRLKRRLYMAQIETDAPPAPGDAVYLPADDGADDSAGHRGDRAAGTIVSAGAESDGHWRVLAVCSIEDAATGKLRLHHVLGPVLQMQDLPYALTDDAA